MTCDTDQHKGGFWPFDKSDCWWREKQYREIVKLKPDHLYCIYLFCVSRVLSIIKIKQIIVNKMSECFFIYRFLYTIQNKKPF